MPAPRLMPVTPIPLANAGRWAKRCLTAIGSSVPAMAMAMPIGSVRASSTTMPGATARPRPATAIASRQPAIAARSPQRPETSPANGANRPMQSTGIVPTSPATACETPKSSWMSGMSGPAPTSWGRRATAASSSAAASSMPSRRACAAGAASTAVTSP